MIYFSFHSLIHPCVSSSSFPPAHSTPEHTYHPSLPLTKQCNRKRSSTCVFFNIKKKRKKQIKICYLRHIKTIQFKDFETTVKELSRDVKSLREYMSDSNQRTSTSRVLFQFFNHRLEPVFFPRLIQNLSQIHENLWTISWESVDICEK